MKIRALAAAATAACLIITPVAAQAGTAASAKTYGSYAAPAVSKVNGAGDVYVKQGGKWVLMTAGAAAAIAGAVIWADNGSGKTPGDD